MQLGMKPKVTFPIVRKRKSENPQNHNASITTSKKFSSKKLDSEVSASKLNKSGSLSSYGGFKNK